MIEMNFKNERKGKTKSISCAKSIDREEMLRGRLSSRLHDDELVVAGGTCDVDGKKKRKKERKKERKKGKKQCDR